MLYNTKRVSPAKASLRLQATIRLAFTLKVSKITVHAAYSPSASLSACLALSELNPQKPAFGCKQLSGWLLLLRYQKSPYMPPTRLRRRDALDQRIASLTRKTWPSAASGYQAIFCSQGIKRPARMSPAFDGLYF